MHDDPSKSLFLAAVTGTNGKSTTVHLISQMLEHGGPPAGRDRHDRDPVGGGSAAARHPHDAGRAHRPAPPGRAPAGGRRLRGARAELPRPRPGAQRRPRRGLRGLHQPDPRPPRLPRGHGGLRRLESGPLRNPETRRSRCRQRRDPASDRMAQAAERCRAHVHRFSTRSRVDLSASKLESDSSGTHFLLQGMGISGTRIHVPMAGRFNVENALAATAVVLLSGASPSARWKGSRPPPLHRGASSASRRVSEDSPAWSTTPTPRMLCAACSVPSGSSSYRVA